MTGDKRTRGRAEIAGDQYVAWTPCHDAEVRWDANDFERRMQVVDTCPQPRCPSPVWIVESPPNMPGQQPTAEWRRS